MRRPHKTGVSPSYIAIYNVTTQRLTTIQQSRTPQSQVAGASADSTWVVWEEADYAPTSSIGPFSPITASPMA